MLDHLLSSHLPDLHVDQIWQTDTLIEVAMTATASTARCPLCGQPSHHVHSRYRRQMTDLTWSGHPVRLHLHVRRFFYANPICSRRIFCERLAEHVAPHARCTRRLAEVQRQVALESGGEGGSRVLATLALPGSDATLVRRIRQQPICVTGSRVLDVDDYALRRGRRYGTLLVDLETHRPVDVLPDRSAASLERWLVEHPGVAIIGRDRAAEYAEGASRGAPQAVQVADRFYPLHNVVDLLHRLLERHQSAVREVGSGRRVSSPPPTTVVSPPNPHQQARRARFEAVKELQAHGLNVSAINRQMNLDRGTVRRRLRAETFPEPAPRRQDSKLDPFVPYLKDQVAAGRHNTTQLWRELCDQHQFTGLRRLVLTWVAAHRSDGLGPSPATVRRQL